MLIAHGSRDCFPTDRFRPKSKLLTTCSGYKSSKLNRKSKATLRLPLVTRQPSKRSANLVQRNTPRTKKKSCTKSTRHSTNGMERMFQKTTEFQKRNTAVK